MVTMKITKTNFGITINDTLITDFRDVVNERDFVYSYFINRNGKNQFSPICSCMDWITVSVRYLMNIPEISEDIDIKAMQIYTIISSIDIIVEAVRQLHRIIESDNNFMKWPFKGFVDIFKNKIHYLSHEDDDSYFKSIRAIFGAHPTNLKNNHGERLFASWPHFYALNNNDFTISLYNNKPGVDDIIFGIKFNELISYVESRYKYLEKLMDSIVVIRNNHYDVLSAQVISSTDNIYDELRLLLSEVAIRGNNDYYRMQLEELIHLFDGCVKEKHLQDEVNEFLSKLYPIVLEIRNNLQKMNIEDLTTTCDVIISRLPTGELNYILQKMFSCLHSDRDDPLKDYYFDTLNKYTEGWYNFCSADNDSTTLLKLRMMLYRYHQQKLD
ncbi:hypothetical protein [Escherichia fergusonii]|uniref:hypothetical protein n=1 Tax=Escherichia fergusonii TaxID=564 RepID=UPI001CBB92A5|nr:hypothetical protein [Escherichia fergusonii]